MDAVDPTMEPIEDILSEDEELPPVRLKEGIDLKEFIDTKSAVFQVNVDDFPEEEEDPHFTYFNKEALLKCSKYECIDDDGDEENDLEPGKTPFEKLAAKMTPVTKDGKVKKKEIQPGHGSVIPPNSHVIVHYNAYLEYGDDPHDSTWLRGCPKKFQLQEGQVIAGFDIAVGTMKMGEVSMFLVHPDMGCGRMGCPPRIPLNAELLFEVELINFFDNTAAEAFEALSIEDKQKQEFIVILKAAQQHHNAGNKAVQKGLLPTAIAKFKKAVKILEKCHMKNEEEEEQQQYMLGKLYGNLAICYNEEKRPKLACVMCKAALEINPMNIKAMFHFGRALIMLSDYKEAQRRLLGARKLEPNNEKITEELKKLERKKEAYKTQQKIFSERAFKTETSQKKEKKETTKAKVTEAFEEAVEQFMSQFIDDGAKGLFSLPTGLTYQEERCVRQKAEEMGLIVRTHEQKGERHLYLSKSDQ